MENPRESWFQLYGRLLRYSEKCEATQRFLEEVEKIAEKPWARARKGFLTAAGGAVMERVTMAGAVSGVTKKENVLSVLCLHDEKKVQVVKYNIKYGSRNTDEIVGNFWRAAMSNDGSTVVYVDADGNVKKWDVASGTKTLLGRSRTSIMYICLSEDSRWVSFVLEGVGKVVVLDTQGDGAPRELWTGRLEDVFCVAVNAIGRKVVCGLREGTIWVWDTESGEAICEALEGHRDTVFSVAFSENGDLIASGSNDFNIRVWNAETGRCLGVVEIESLVTALAFAERGKKVLWGSFRGPYGFWEHEKGGAIAVVGDTGRQVTYVGTSQDGSVGFCGCKDGTVRVWDVRGGQPEIDSGDEDGHDDRISRDAISPDGRWIASGSEDGTIRLWDGETGKLLPEVLRGHTGAVWDVSFGEDGRRLLSGGFDKTVRVWDVPSGHAIGDALRGHNSSVHCVMMCADGTRAASGSAVGEVRVWDMQRAAAVGDTLRGHTAWITGVALSPDGTRVASAALDKTVRVWDVASHVATHLFSFRDYPRFISLGSLSAVVWLRDRTAYLCSLADSTCVLHPASPRCPWGSNKMELSDSHRCVWLGTAETERCRPCKLGFFYSKGNGLRFCEVLQ